MPMLTLSDLQSPTGAAVVVAVAGGLSVVVVGYSYWYARAIFRDLDDVKGLLQDAKQHPAQGPTQQPVEQPAQQPTAKEDLKQIKPSDSKSNSHPAVQRDVVGYGPDPPSANWPNGALVAINFVINVEEGSEPSILDGDGYSSCSLCECGSDAPTGVRDLAAESMFEYGSRCGVWRVLRVLQARDVPATVFACALALERNPLLAAAIKNTEYDICCHGWRWEDHIDMDVVTEKQRIKDAVASLLKTTGTNPVGWYCRTAPSTNTRRLLVEHGGFEYDSDAYNDDLPYWTRVEITSETFSDATSDASTSAAAVPTQHWHLVLPYSLCTNDSKFAPGRAFSVADDYFTFMKDSVVALVKEAKTTGRPKMMSVGLHPRLIGHPARIVGLEKFLDFINDELKDQAWVCRRIDIANHWKKHHPPPHPTHPHPHPYTGTHPQPQPQPRDATHPHPHVNTHPHSHTFTQSSSHASPSSFPVANINTSKYSATHTPTHISSSTTTPTLSDTSPQLNDDEDDNNNNNGHEPLPEIHLHETEDNKRERNHEGHEHNERAHEHKHEHAHKHEHNHEHEHKHDLHKPHATPYDTPRTSEIQPAVLPTGQRLLVTGGAGFVLSNLVHHWLDSDITSTVVIFDQARAMDHHISVFLSRFIDEGCGRVQFFDGDVTSALSWEALEVECGCEFTHVVSGAAVTPTSEEEARAPATVLQVNLVGTVLALEFARNQCTKLKRFLHVSSDAVLGVPHLLTPSTRPPSLNKELPHMSLYAISKVAGETSVQRWKELFDMDTVTVRFSDVYGRLDRDTGARNRHNAPFWVCKKALEQEAMTLAAKFTEYERSTVNIAAGSVQEHCWDMIDAPSVARALRLILLSPTQPKQQLYHIALGRTPTHAEVIQAVNESLPQSIELQFKLVDVSNADASVMLQSAVSGEIDLNSLEKYHWLFTSPMDIKPMFEEFGWKPMDLNQAINEYMTYLRSQARNQQIHDVLSNSIKQSTNI